MSVIKPEIRESFSEMKTYKEVVGPLTDNCVTVLTGLFAYRKAGYTDAETQRELEAASHQVQGQLDAYGATIRGPVEDFIHQELDIMFQTAQVRYERLCEECGIDVSDPMSYQDVYEKAGEDGLRTIIIRDLAGGESDKLRYMMSFR